MIPKGTKINLDVVATGGFGIATLPIEVEYNGDPVQFHKDIVVNAATRGYTAILNYKGHFEALMKWVDHIGAFEMVLEKILKTQCYEPLLKAVRHIKTLPSEMKDEYIAECEKKGIALWEYNGKWLVGYNDDEMVSARRCGWEENLLCTEWCKAYWWLDGFTKAMDFAGLDGSGAEKTRNICHNLGIDG